MRIALDTNVLVRYLTWDEPTQSARAARSIEAAEAVVIPTTILCEVVWVLRRAFRLGHREVAGTLRALVASGGVETDRLAAEAGLAMLDRGGDFADGVILHEAERARAGRVVSFDRAFIDRAGPGRVVEPG